MEFKTSYHIPYQYICIQCNGFLLSIDAYAYRHVSKICVCAFFVLWFECNSTHISMGASFLLFYFNTYRWLETLTFSLRTTDTLVDFNIPITNSQSVRCTYITPSQSFSIYFTNLFLYMHISPHRNCTMFCLLSVFFFVEKQ